MLVLQILRLFLLQSQSYDGTLLEVVLRALMLAYDIFCASSQNFSGTAMLVQHELKPIVEHNDVARRWLIVQCYLYVQTFEFATVYAPE